MLSIPRTLGVQLATVLSKFGATSADIDDTAIVGMAADMGLLQPQEVGSFSRLLDPIEREPLLITAAVDVWLALREEVRP